MATTGHTSTRRPRGRRWLVWAALLWPGVAWAQGDGGGADAGGADGEVADRGAAVAPAEAELAGLRQRVRILEERMAAADAVAARERQEAGKTREKVEDLSKAIQLSGFFDVSVSTYGNHPNVFALGAFEFDLNKSFNKYFQVSAALVFEDSAADLAVGFIDLHLLGGLIPARGNIFLESGFHLQVGRFDVPLGNDWLYFAALDRPTISAPLTTENLMEGGYNDVGFRVVGNYRFCNYAGYVLEGVGNGVAVGGRLAIIPFNNPFTLAAMEEQPLDVGISHLRDYSQVGTLEQEVTALDLEARFAFLRGQAEYYQRRNWLERTSWWGYQGALFGNFLDDGPVPFGVGLRLDQIHVEAMDEPGGETLARGTVSGFLRPYDVTVLKVEYQHYFRGNEEQRGDQVFAQLVIGFK
jgi:hypothetical protein